MSSNNILVADFDVTTSDSLNFTLKALPAVEGGILVELTGFIDTYNSSYFQDQITKIINAGYKKIIFDCTRLTAIASTGFGVLTNLLKMVNMTGGDIVLACVPQQIMETFELLGFVRFFKIKNDVNEALSCFMPNVSEQPEIKVFPKLIQCPACGKTLKAARSGKFRCVGCKGILVIDDNGVVTAGV